MTDNQIDRLIDETAEAEAKAWESMDQADYAAAQARRADLMAAIREVKPHVLRYWEQEFTQLKPVKRRGNRRYYQHHEVLLIRRIRELLYEQGFTISGARNRLDEGLGANAARMAKLEQGTAMSAAVDTSFLRREIESVLELLRA